MPETTEKPKTLEQLQRRLYGENTKRRCTECGFRVRGLNHESGDHHRRGKSSKHKPE